MNELLKKLELSDNEIKIYNECLGKSPLTYSELYSLLPNLSQKDFKNVINKLINTNLFIQIEPIKSEILLHYLAIPPFNPILNYYSNINVNLSEIQNSIHNLIVSALNRIFKENNKVEMDTIYNQFQEIKKDIIEDSLIQKKDVEDFVRDFEKLKEIKSVLSSLKEIQSDLLKKIKNITQTQLVNLITILTEIKIEIINRIKILEFKKKEVTIINVVENVFKEKLQQMIQEFASTINLLIEVEFKNSGDLINKRIIKPINDIVGSMFQYQNDFKLLYLNVINNFELKMNKIQKLIKTNKDNIGDNLKDLENLILNNIKDIIQDSIKQISELSKPIEDFIQKYLERTISSKKERMNNVWFINSKIKINEEIKNILNNSKENIIFIIPNIENYLKKEQLQILPKNLKVKLASSDPHTNSLIKSLKEINNLEFRTLKNENFFALKGDNNYIIIAITIKNSQEPLNDIIGIGSNYKPLITILTPLIETSWATAQPYLSTSLKTPIHSREVIQKSISIKNQQPLITSKSVIQKTLPSEKIQQENSRIGAEPVQKEQIIQEHAPVDPNKPHQTQEPQIQNVYMSKIYPKAGDEVGMKINNAFNILLQKLNVIKSDEFSKELQKIADLILEKRGFSVTLHKIRTLINSYKDKESFLDEYNKNLIFEEIERWKQRLF